MAKRSAEFQMAKESNGGPDFSFGASPTEAGGIQPPKATAAQMAGRKIATARKSRVAPSQAGGAPPIQQPSNFSFSSTPTNSWAGSFGNTSSTFGTGTSPTTSVPEQKPFSFTGFGQTESSSKPTFAPFGQSQSFGGAVATSSPTTSGTPAATNLFSFGSNTANSFPPDKSTSPSTNIFGAQSQPTVNGTSGTAQTNPFQSQPTTNGVQPSKPSNPFSFSTTTSPSPANPFAAKPAATTSNLFDSATKPNSDPSLFSPTPASATPPPVAAEEAMSADQVARLKQFIATIEPKFQSMDRFKQEVRAQVQSMPQLTKDKSVDQVVEDFATQLQKAQPLVNSWNPGSSQKIAFTPDSTRLLVALLDKHIPVEKKAEGAFFTPKQPESNTSFTSTNTEPVQKNMFGAQPAAPTLTAAPTPTTPTIDISTLRDMLRNEAKQQLPKLLQASTKLFDANKLDYLLPTLFSTSFSSLSQRDLPANVDIAKLRDAARDGVAETFAQLRSQDESFALSEDSIRHIFSHAFSAALPSIRKTVEDASALRQPAEAQPTLEEGLSQLRELKEQCEHAQPPNALAAAPYSIDKLNASQKQQYVGGWRVRLFITAASEVSRKFRGDPSSTVKLAEECERLRLSLADTVGLKRKRGLDAEDETDNGPNKRPNFGSSISNGSSDKPLFTPFANNASPMFGAPSGDKRPAEGNDSDPAAKRAREDTSSNAAKSGSQTSQLFASLTQKGQNESASKSTPPPNMFAAAATEPSTTSALKPPQFNVAPAAAGTNFMAQFNKMAAQTAEKEKAKRKAEDYDSEEETEEEWEKRDAAEQLAKKQKLMESTKSAGFVPKFGEKSSNEVSKDSDADNEDSTEEPSPDTGAKKSGSRANAEDLSTTPKAPTPGRSLFDRVQEAPKDGATTGVAPSGDKTWKPDSPIRFGDASGSSTFSAGSSQPKSNSGDINSSKTLFGSTTPAAGQGSTSIFGSKPAGTTPANPFAPAGGATKSSAPSFNFTAASPEKTPGDKPKNPFHFPSSSTAASGDSGKDQPKSLFDSAPKPSGANPFGNPFGNYSESSSIFSTPSGSAAGSGLAPTSVFATAGSSRATSPGLTTGDESTGSGAGEEVPKDPQLDLSEARAGEEHETSMFEVKAKASEYVPKDDDSGEREWAIRGVGLLRLLKHDDTGKTRIVLRAGPASRVVLNVALLPNTSYTNPTAKSVSFVASNSGRVAKWTLQVGKVEDATKLRELLEKHKDD